MIYYALNKRFIKIVVKEAAMRMIILILFFLIIFAAIALWFKILTSAACPHCGSKNIAPAKNDDRRGYGTKWECFNPDCSKTFYFLPLISHRSK